MYHSNLDARSFVNGDGGWEKGNGTTGLCLPPLTCPGLVNGFVSSGGTPAPVTATCAPGSSG